MRAPATLLLLLLFLPACQEPLPDADLLDNLWNLESVYAPGEPIILVGATRVYNIQFLGDYHLEGRDDCNSIVGNYVLSEDSKLRLDNLLTTLVGCGPSEIGNRYFQALRQVHSYKIDGHVLRLYYDDDSVLKYRLEG